MESKSKKSVKVSAKELNDIKVFFSDNPGARTKCEKEGFASIPTVWRFLATGKARRETIMSIREFIKNYEPATI